MPTMNIVSGAPGDQFRGSSTTTKRGHPLGSAMQFADGRRFRYAKAAGTAIAVAKLCQQTLNDANFDELVVPTARAAGDRTVTLTTGATAVTLDQLADGWAVVEDDTGEGYIYTIKSNPAAGTTSTLTLELYEELQVAWTTSTTVGIFVNPYAATIIHPSPATALLTGITVSAMSASRFGWLATWGPAICLVEGTWVINEGLIDSASADGAAAPTASTAAGEENYVGLTMEVTATTEHGLMFAKIS